MLSVAEAPADAPPKAERALGMGLRVGADEQSGNGAAAGLMAMSRVRRAGFILAAGLVPILAVPFQEEYVNLLPVPFHHACRGCLR